DEVFDAAAADEAGFTIVGEAALLAALERHRTGRMGDIVATIQAEQDEAVRAPLSGIIVVAGGPGTGKTAVALHRAAYLLYTHRQRLASRGVLLVGPSPIFLRYIDEVLPSLGEDDVQLTTVAGLKPQLRARASEPPALARGERAPDDWEAELSARLRRTPEVRAALERMWPVLSGAELVHDLFSFPALIRSAADGVLSRDEDQLLARPRSSSVRDVDWT